MVPQAARTHRKRLAMWPSFRSRRARNSSSDSARRRRPTLRLQELESRLAPATTRTWMGTFDQFWDFAGNWKDNNGNPGAPQTGDILVFSTSASSLLSTNNLGPDKVFESIRVESSGYLITGDRVKLTSAVPVATNFSSGSSTIALAVDFTNGSNIDVNGGSTLSLNGIVSGSRGLAKRQAGTLNLGGNNTYGGATDIQAGTVRKSASVNGIPDTSNVTVALGATLDLNNTNDSIATLSGRGNVQLGGNGGNFLTVGLGDGSSSFEGQ